MPLLKLRIKTLRIVIMAPLERTLRLCTEYVNNDLQYIAGKCLVANSFH